MSRKRSTKNAVLAIVGACCGIQFPVQSPCAYATAGTPPAGLVQVITRPVQVRYIHDLSTARIGSMRREKFHYKGMHNPGITLAEHELKTDYQIGGIRRTHAGPYNVWAETIRLDFSYIRMDVYISSQYAEGTCPYKVIREHENQHVAINTALLARYKDLMERALLSDANIPTRAHPLRVTSLSMGKSLIAARINRTINPLYQRFKRSLLAENGRIDTPENYRRAQARCREW